MLVDIVLGCSYGNEGKSKVVYNLLKNDEYDLCVRFNSSGNTNHKIYYNDNTQIIIHQLPIGILTNCKNLISSDCLINIDKLKEEIEYIKSFGINIKDRLMISKSCHIYNTNSNKILNKRAEDFSHIFNEMGIEIVDMVNFWVENNFKKVLLEEVTSDELDINSSYLKLSKAINTGIPLKSINFIYGIAKCYDTFVGNINFQSDDPDLDKIREYGEKIEINEGKRQCNYLNLDKLNNELRINQCNFCIINKVDILEDLNIFKLYYKNELLTFNNMDDMKDFIDENTNIYIIYSSNPVTIS